MNIAQNVSDHSFGIDLSRHAVPFWKRRGLKRVCLASVNDLPFPDGTFDVVVCLDVLESDSVIEATAYRELWRVARDGGVIIIVVPAYRWLLTREHHRAVHASRRYTKQRLIALLRGQPVQLVRISYLFALLFPAIAGYRLARRLLGNGRSDLARSELWRLPRPVNAVLYGVMTLERVLLRSNVNLPFGSSLLAVVRKISRG
jgi:SAM-dependent methyltransferase